MFVLIFSSVEKRLDLKDQVSFKFYDVTTWETNNCNHVLLTISRSKVNEMKRQ